MWWTCLKEIERERESQRETERARESQRERFWAPRDALTMAMLLEMVLLLCLATSEVWELTE